MPPLDWLFSLGILYGQFLIVLLGLVGLVLLAAVCVLARPAVAVLGL